MDGSRTSYKDVDIRMGTDVNSRFIRFHMNNAYPLVQIQLGKNAVKKKTVKLSEVIAVIHNAITISFFVLKMRVLNLCICYYVFVVRY